MTIIDCISDLHGHLPVLKGGDLLIVAGDITGRDKIIEWAKFFAWFKEQKYQKKILIAGNHDGFLSTGFPKTESEYNDLIEVRNFLGEEPHDFDYLCDSGTEFNGLKIWGSPWTKVFYNWHFMMSPDKLEKHWDSIPVDTDILITHGPAYNLLDKVKALSNRNEDKSVGCPGLRKKIEEIKPKLFVCGHIHEGYGKLIIGDSDKITLYANASIMTENYEPINKPIRVELGEGIQRFIS